MDDEVKKIVIIEHGKYKKISKLQRFLSFLFERT